MITPLLLDTLLVLSILWMVLGIAYTTTNGGAGGYKGRTKVQNQKHLPVHQRHKRSIIWWEGVKVLLPQFSQLFPKFSHLRNQLK